MPVFRIYQAMIRFSFRLLFLLFFATPVLAQNLVPNPSFETISSYAAGSSLLSCADDWKNNTYLINPAMNSADLQFNGSTFFTSINAYDGIRFAAMDCEVSNPEYIQVKLTSPMIAGTTYCVSFYSSFYDRFTIAAPFMGAYFSASQLTVNPYNAGIAASVEQSGPTDPTVWTQISGTYVATGGEQYMTLGCFRGNLHLFSYMYVDMVDVHPITISVDLGPDQPLCAGDQLQLDAGAGGSSYLWNTGATTSSITVTAPGIYWVAKYSGACPVTDTIELTSSGCNNPAIPVADGELYIPNSFSPNGDGINDLFGAKGENISNFEMNIYNRWGEHIFSSYAISDQWDGKYNKQTAPEGVYVYTLNYQNGSRKHSITGHIVLLK